MAKKKNCVENKRKKNPTSKNEMKKKKEKTKECMRKLRKSIRNDPQKYEEQKRKERERYYARKKAGKIKGMHEMGNRDQRKVRKSWRERSKKYCLKKKFNKKLEDNTPSTNPVPGPSRDNTICRRPQLEVDFEREHLIVYQRWVTKKMKITVKGEEKICQKTVKEEVTCMQEELVSILEDSVVKFLMHVRNINHQQTTMNGIKKMLTSNDVLIHADFSENYVCKYGREVQSSHFGGSKQQITLHTVVVYHLSPDTLELKVTSYCSLSDSLRHDPSAICAHLKPIIMEIKHSQPSLKTAHIFTDSPVTQYRNRKMFYLIATFLAPELGVDALNWHYTESGHGKGPPDGVGGCLKRIADSLVGRGKDMNNFNRLTDELAANSKKINVIK
ncbi:hypothetical protein AVEN_123649-1, partial [Araneus ventricosus]